MAVRPSLTGTASAIVVGVWMSVYAAFSCPLALPATDSRGTISVQGSIFARSDFLTLLSQQHQVPNGWSQMDYHLVSQDQGPSPSGTTDVGKTIQKVTYIILCFSCHGIASNSKGLCYDFYWGLL